MTGAQAHLRPARVKHRKTSFGIRGHAVAMLHAIWQLDQGMRPLPAHYADSLFWPVPLPLAQYPRSNL